MIMKKYLKIVFISVMAVFMASCDRDDLIAEDLSGGIWEGTVTTDYVRDRWGSTSEVYQYVDMQFEANPYRYAKGTGLERDYSKTRVVRCPFDFEVDRGIIYLYYDDGTDVEIRNYRLSGDRFTGSFYNSRTGKWMADFTFTRYSSWRDERYYYAPKELTDSVK